MSFLTIRPPIDQEFLASIASSFEETMETGTNPQKKDLLRRLVQKVKVHDRRTIEVWYCLPNRSGFEHWNTELPDLGSNQGPSG